MIHHRFPLQFNSTKLLGSLAKVGSSEWIPHYSAKDYEGSWSIAPLRAPAGLSTAIWSTPMPEIYENTEILNRSPYFQEVLSHLECVTTSVRLMKLEPGAEIKEHEDSLGDDEARIHVPIQTNSGVEFYLADQRVVMEPGSCWYLDFTKPHRIINKGSALRVHMVIDCFKNDWLRNQLGEQ